MTPPVLPDITDIRVELARVNGKLDVITTQMSAAADARAAADDFAKERGISLAADLGVVKAELREDRKKAELGINGVRADLEVRLVSLERWQSQLRGMAFVLPPVSAILTVLAGKAIGGS